MNARDAHPDELVDWDARTVDTPGGHVYQSRAWAEHRRSSGWSPRFLVTADGGRVLALTRPWPVIGGGSGYLPRGPVPGATGVEPATIADRQIAVSEALARDGIDVVAADPEVAASARAYRERILVAGFHPIEELQPSRHRISLPLAPRADETVVFEGIAKSTRQRIRAAERDGVTVVRHDTRAGAGGVGEGFAVPAQSTPEALDHFYDLLRETSERLHFPLGPRAGFAAWSQAAHQAGYLILLEARSGSAAHEPLAGLTLYRHGGRLSTVHSGDHAAARADHPGALHVLRWRAIQLAIREGCTEMDLGGVDVHGARGEPHEGDPLYGLYQHKRAFSGRWLELTGAHERTFDAPGYALGRLTSGVARLIRR